MPRDIPVPDSKDDSLVASPRPSTPKLDGPEVATATSNDGYQEMTIHRHESRESNLQHFHGSQPKADEKNNLNPYVHTLSLSNLESCVALENAVFPEHERCSREKVDNNFLNSPSIQIFQIYPCQKKNYLFSVPIPLFTKTLTGRVTAVNIHAILTSRILHV